ncbi:MAG TPA: hypothetical protein PKB02_01660 [Anaerohalosphaeraceae bacterium]|nr:hypothetical protein [Anaerohalosphaeraceae bacterium]
MAQQQVNIAQIIYEAYPHSDLLSIDPGWDCCDLSALLERVTTNDIGDGLFRFMVVEIVEGGESTLDGAIRVMERAKQDVVAVLQALRNAQICQNQPSYFLGTTEDLLDALKTLVSYTSDLVYRLDNQVNLDEIEEIRQAKAAIAQYVPADTSVQEGRMILKEQSADCPQVTISIHLVCGNGQLWIQPKSYGEKCAEDGEGFPIGIEIWEGKLRLIVFNDINSEDPQIINLENAKESCRIEESQEDCSRYCAVAEYIAEHGRKIFTGHMNGGLWNARCMDACILSKKKNDKAAYEFLLKFGDQYAQAISDEQKDVWQKIKDSAAAMLNPATP